MHAAVGFRNWLEGLELIIIFSSIIAIPCVFVAIFGTRMMNDLGNFPTKAAQIQMRGWYWIVSAEVFSFGLLAIFYQIFS